MLKKSTFFLALRLLTALCGLLISIILINFYGTSTAALYTVHTATLGIISAIMRFGQQTYVVKKYKVSDIGLWVVIIYLISIILALFPIALANQLFSLGISPLVLLGAVFHSLNILIVAVVRKLGRDFEALAYENMVPAFVQTVFLCVAILTKFSQELVAFGYVFSTYLTFLISLSFSTKNGYLKGVTYIPARISLNRFKLLLKIQFFQSCSFFLVSLSGSLIYKYIPIKLLETYGATEVAAFRIASNFYNIGDLILNNMRKLIVRKTIKITKTSRPQILALRKAARISFVGCAFYFALMLFFGKEIIAVFFEIDKEMTWTMIIWLLLANLISAATGFHGLILNMTKNHWLAAKISTLSFGIFMTFTYYVPVLTATTFILQFSLFLGSLNILFFIVVLSRLKIRSSLL